MEAEGGEGLDKEGKEMGPDGQMFVQGARRERASPNVWCGGQGWEEENPP